MGTGRAGNNQRGLEIKQAEERTSAEVLREGEHGVAKGWEDQRKGEWQKRPEREARPGLRPRTGGRASHRAPRLGMPRLHPCTAHPALNHLFPFFPPRDTLCLFTVPSVIFVPSRGTRKDTY